MNYFANCQTINDVKTLYRKLVFKFHPDVNPGIDESAIKEINNQYHAKLKSFDGFTVKGSDNKDHTYRYNWKVEQEIIEKIFELLALQMINVKIELIGTWIWISGNTREYRKELKSAKCIWHSKRKMWYWRKSRYRRRYSNKDFDSLRQMYGSKNAEDFDEKDKSVSKAA